jgi:Predicted membrane protein
MDGDFASEPAASKALSDDRRLRPARARTTPSRIALKIGFVFMSGAERRGRRTPAGGYAMGMAMRFVVYGVLGWAVEIIWTGLGSLLRRDPRLTGRTYLWMFPVYGGGGLLFERLYAVIHEQPWGVRGLVWTAAIFAVEYVSGAVIRRLAGRSPWDYSGAALSVGGLIRLDYAPLWFGLGLLFERVYLFLLRG